MSSKLSILLDMLKATELTLVIKSSYISVFVSDYLFFHLLVLVFICSKANHVAIFGKEEKMVILRKKSYNLHYIIFECNTYLPVLQIQLSKQFTQNAKDKDDF